MKPMKHYTYDWFLTWLDTYVKNQKAEKTYKSYLDAILLIGRKFPELHDMPVDEMTEIYAQNVLKELASSYSYSQLNVIRVVFDQAFAKAYYNHLCPYNPIHRLSIPPQAHKGKVSALTRMEQEAVVAAASHMYLGHIALFFLETGIRRSELVNLKWADFNLQREELYIRKSKTDAGIRTIPLTQLALRILLTEPKSSRDPYIFHNKAGNPVSYTNLCRLYKRLRKVTGIPNITNHIYRHTFATRFLEDGTLRVKSLAMILGHTDVAFTMQRYAQPDTEFLHEQMRAFDHHRNGH